MSEGSPKWRIEPIRKDHVRSAFDCGVSELDDFIRKYARQNERLGLGRTFVATRGRGGPVLGYFTLRAGSVECRALPLEETKRFPKYPVPVVHLAKLAVDRSARGEGLGERLLLDALRRAFDASVAIAAFAVEVIAIDARARDFYVRYGFKPLVNDELHLYLSMKTLSKIFG